MAAAKTATGALYQALLADAAVAALLDGASANPRVFIDVAPQGTRRPYVTLQTIQDSSVHHVGGVEALRDPLVQVDAWGSTAAERDELAAALRARLDGLANLDVADAFVRVVALERVQNSAEPRNDGSGYTFRWSADARTWYVPK